MQGLKTLRHRIEGLLSIPFEALARRNERVEGFDERFGTRTSDIIKMSKLADSADKNALHSQYFPAAVMVVDRILRSVPIARQEWTFVDVGAGMGRVTLIASELPFKRVIGIEYSQELHAIAIANERIHAERATRRSAIELHCADAAEFTYPDDDLFLFLFDPFRRPVMERFLDRLLESPATANRGLLIAYYIPEEHASLAARPELRVLKTERLFRPFYGRPQSWTLYGNSAGAARLARS